MLPHPTDRAPISSNDRNLANNDSFAPRCCFPTDFDRELPRRRNARSTKIPRALAPASLSLSERGRVVILERISASTDSLFAGTTYKNTRSKKKNSLRERAEKPGEARSAGGRRS